MAITRSVDHLYFSWINGNILLLITVTTYFLFSKDKLGINVFLPFQSSILFLIVCKSLTLFLEIVGNLRNCLQKKPCHFFLSKYSIILTCHYLLWQHIFNIQKISEVSYIAAFLVFDIPIWVGIKGSFWEHGCRCKKQNKIQSTLNFVVKIPVCSPPPLKKNLFCEA